jgi:hypothetical protein
MGVIRAVLRGAAAGAAGTTALNAATYLDMTLRARAASEMPGKAVDALAERIGQSVPGVGEARDHRREGLGALMGIATGVGVGIAAGLLSPVLTRMPLVMSAAVVGGGAMLGSDRPMTELGLTDPKSWSATDWASDAVPHFVYGVATVATLRALRS